MMKTPFFFDKISQIGLYTDYYELLMAQGYFFQNRLHEQAVFDYFFRSNPFGGGYTIFSGLSDLADCLLGFSFSKEALTYLEKEGFKPEFLHYLSSLRFSGNVSSVREGEIVFPYEPILRMEGSLIETQLLETVILNFLNFESLIATKAARVTTAAQGRSVIDFGLRRAHGLGGLQASKAARIGGVSSSSNVIAGYVFGLPIQGTMAHSWIQSFPTELEAFQVFSRLYPQLCILLVDTYDTLRSGVPHAIHIAKELEAKGFRLKGIRIDSGDLAYLAKKARYMLDREGCSDTAIFVSNQLDEWIIRSLLEQKAPIDGFGVGTRLVTGEGSAALDGVYKLCQIHGMPSMKLSENTVKMTFPGVKKTVRFLDKNGQFFADGIVLDTETRTEQLTHPFFPDKRCEVNGLESHPLFLNIFKNGKRVADFPSLDESAQYAKTRLEKLPEEHKRFENPHAYKVGVSDALLQLIDQCKKSCSQ